MGDRGTSRRRKSSSSASLSSQEVDHVASSSRRRSIGSVVSSSGRPQRTTCLSTAATHALAFQESLVCGLIEDACVHFSGPRLPVDPSIEECYRSVARLCEHTAAHDHRWRKQALRRAVSRGACYRNRYFGTVDQPEEQTRASAFTTAPVAAIAAHVYDLRGVESSNDATLELGMGVFHVGVEVFGVEWSFGCVVGGDLITGIYPVRPKRCPIGRYRESIYLGEARAHDARRVWSLIESFTETWIGKEYHPLHKNCVHFCEELHASGVQLWGSSPDGRPNGSEQWDRSPKGVMGTPDLRETLNAPLLFEVVGHESKTPKTWILILAEHAATLIELALKLVEMPPTLVETAPPKSSRNLARLDSNNLDFGRHHDKFGFAGNLCSEAWEGKAGPARNLQDASKFGPPPAHAWTIPTKPNASWQPTRSSPPASASTPSRHGSAAWRTPPTPCSRHSWLRWAHSCFRPATAARSCVRATMSQIFRWCSKEGGPQLRECVNREHSAHFVFRSLLATVPSLRAKSTQRGPSLDKADNGPNSWSNLVRIWSNPVRIWSNTSQLRPSSTPVGRSLRRTCFTLLAPNPDIGRPHPRSNQRLLGPSRFQLDFSAQPKFGRDRLGLAYFAQEARSLHHQSRDGPGELGAPAVTFRVHSANSCQVWLGLTNLERGARPSMGWIRRHLGLESANSCAGFDQVHAMLAQFMRSDQVWVEFNRRRVVFAHL